MVGNGQRKAKNRKKKHGPCNLGVRVGGGGGAVQPLCGGERGGGQGGAPVFELIEVHVGESVSFCDPVCDDVGWVMSPKKNPHTIFFLSSCRCVATGKRATSNLTLPPIGRPPLFPFLLSLVDGSGSVPEATTVPDTSLL
jgi:hypothetical protein